MPEVDGFAVLSALGRRRRRRRVRHRLRRSTRVRAFDADAVDYLLKPFDASRLARALARARKRADGDAVSPRLDALLAAAAPPARLPVRIGERIEMIEVADIDYLVAEGNYVAIHVAGRSHLVRERRCRPWSAASIRAGSSGSTDRGSFASTASGRSSRCSTASTG